MVPCWYVAGQPIDLIPRCNNGFTRGSSVSPSLFRLCLVGLGIGPMLSMSCYCN